MKENMSDLPCSPAFEDHGVPVNTGTVQTPYPAGTPNAETGLEMIIPGLIGSGMIGSGGLLTYLTRRRKQ
mgnify:CR=1 FL=1